MVSYINVSLTHVGTLTKKQGTSRQNPGPHPRTPERTETEFFTDSVSLNKLYLGLTQAVG